MLAEGEGGISGKASNLGASPRPRRRSSEFDLWGSRGRDQCVAPSKTEKIEIVNQAEGGISRMAPNLGASPRVPRRASTRVFGLLARQRDRPVCHAVKTEKIEIVNQAEGGISRMASFLGAPLRGARRAPTCVFGLLARHRDRPV